MRDIEWLIPVSGIVFAELCLWWIAYMAGAAHPPMIAPYWTALTISFGFVVVAWLLWTIGRMALNGVEHPSRQLVADLRANWVRALIIVASIHLVALGSSAFAALKGGIPEFLPFWLDKPLADFEEIGGIAPWQISHYLLGWGTFAIDRLYATFVPIHLITVFVLLLRQPSKSKSQAIISLSLAWLVIGIFGAYLCSSAGPIFYDRVFGGERFRELTDTIYANAPMTVKTAEFLWTAHAANRPEFFNGISAMPSMHVALTLWLALMLNPTKAAVLGWVNYAIILTGSVHLGWHYLSDGIVGSMMMLALWRVAPRLAFRTGQSALSDEPQAIHS